MNQNQILVIDDDPDIATMIKIMLEYRGFKVLIAPRAELAEEILRKEDISVVVMDMLLSGSNGTDICRQFKGDKDIAHVPVIMISAHPNAKEICIEAGADDFISKPFDMNDMVAKVRSFVKPI
jgi:DNA-binding response OmpR family regulator